MARSLPFGTALPTALGIIAATLSCSPSHSQSARITSPSLTVSPETALVDVPVRIRATGLGPHDTATIVAYMAYAPSKYFVSRGTFVANENGTIDLAAQPPLSGTYAGVDAMGLFWSVTPDNLPAALLPSDSVSSFDPPAPYTMKLTLLRRGQRLANASATRKFLGPGVRSETISERGLVGTLFLPNTTRRAPAVVVLSGSEGGNESTRLAAALLASHGFAALALAYFGAPGLPDELFRIPLEYVRKAIDVLQARSDIDGSHIATFGGSKGGELALLTAATYPDIKAVVAYSAPSVVGSGITRSGETKPISSWTLSGQEIPYLKSDSSPPPSAFAQFRGHEPVRLRLIFEPQLRDARAVQRAGIPVERIHGGILLVTGGDDQMGTPLHATIIAERLRANNFAFPFESYLYPDAGHEILQPFLPAGPRTVPGRFAIGGTAEGYAKADADSWPRVLRFLNAMLRPDSK